jgi:hypothetical protein
MIPRGNIVAHFLINATLTPVAVGANATAEQSFTVDGLVPGDFVMVASVQAQTANVDVHSARVVTPDTLLLAFSNSTAGPLTPVAGSYRLLISRPESVQDLPPSAG